MGKDVSKKDGPDAATDRHHIDVAALHEFGGGGREREKKSDSASSRN
jgi:hypothetical protein